MTGPAPISPEFQNAAAQPVERSRRRKSSPPFSLRLTAEERARLKRDAGDKPMGAYIRSLLFDVVTNPHLRQGPTAFHETLALVLAALGKSGLAASMNELARAASAGALESTPELTSQLEGACRDIREIRQSLIVALGIKPED